MSGVSLLWNGSLSEYNHVTASQAYVCAKAVSATETHLLQHRLGVIDSHAKGPLAPSWFSFSTRGVLWDLEFMLQYISRTAYDCNEDEKKTETKNVYFNLCSLEFYIL